jgi:hypothetical protein
MESVKWYGKTIQTCIQSIYLRQPTQINLEKLLKINEECEFPRMLASIDCMHYKWKKIFSS